MATHTRVAKDKFAPTTPHLELDLPPETLQQLEAHARAEGCSVDELMARALTEYFARRPRRRRNRHRP